MAALVRFLVIATLAVPLYSVAFAQERVEKPFTVGQNVLVSSAIRRLVY